MSLTCPSCTTPLPERGFYCPECAIQVRCKQCHEPLEMHAHACVMCGSSVANSEASDGKPTATINTFELQEDLRSRTVRLHLTDEAVAHVGEALTVVFADRITSRPRGAQRIAQQADSPAVLLLPTSPPTSADEDVVAVVPPAASAEDDAPSAGSDRERLHRVFEYDGDGLRLEEDRLKAVSGQDYVRRLTYLFLYANELEGRKPLPYADLKKILEAAKLWDANTRYAISHKLSLEIADSQVRLKTKGRELAVAALNEILDPNHPDPGWTLEVRGRTTKALPEAKDAKAANGGGKGGRKRSTQAEGWATQWEKHSEHVNGHFALKDKPLHDKAILALWAIHKVGGKAASGRFVQRFVKSAFSYDENERSITNALVRKQAEDLVIKTDGGYKLTPTGTRYAEALAKKS